MSVHKSDKCANVQMCKCANVQKTVVHKMRKSAAQIFFQMQLLQIHKSALCTNLQMQNSRPCTIYFYNVKYFLCILEKLLFYIKKFTRLIKNKIISCKK